MDRTIGYAWYKVAAHNGSEYAVEASEKLFDELSEESKAEAVRKADEYISKYADRILILLRFIKNNINITRRTISTIDDIIIYVVIKITPYYLF